MNGVDTETKGIDFVLAWKRKLGGSKFGATFVGNINEMNVIRVKNNGLDQETFFGEREIAFLKASAPNSKLGLNLNYSRSIFDAGLAFTRFSKVVLVDYAGADNVYEVKD